MFNLITGVAELGSDRVRLLGEIGGLPSRLIARRGVAHLPARQDAARDERAGERRLGRPAQPRGHPALRRGPGGRGGAPPLPRAERQLERVGLREQMHEPAGALALGQARLMEIARALVPAGAAAARDRPPRPAPPGEAKPRPRARQLRARREACCSSSTTWSIVDLTDRIVVMGSAQADGGTPAKCRPVQRVRAPASVDALMTSPIFASPERARESGQSYGPRSARLRPSAGTAACRSALVSASQGTAMRAALEPQTHRQQAGRAARRSANTHSSDVDAETA